MHGGRGRLARPHGGGGLWRWISESLRLSFWPTRRLLMSIFLEIQYRLNVLARGGKRAWGQLLQASTGIIEGVWFLPTAEVQTSQLAHRGGVWALHAASGQQAVPVLAFGFCRAPHQVRIVQQVSFSRQCQYLSPISWGILGDSGHGKLAWRSRQEDFGHTTSSKGPLKDRPSTERT